MPITWNKHHKLLIHIFGFYFQMDTSVSGKDADTVVRDRSTGRRRDLKQEQMRKNEEQKKKELKDQKYAEWGKG